MIDKDYFRKIQNQYGLATMNDAVIAEAKMNLRDELMTSVHYVSGLRNGVAQNFVVTPSEAYHKYEIEAMPDEELCVGDEIEVCDLHWVVVKTRPVSPFQTIGLMWMCNHKFRWQNGTPEIIERWGVLDSGVYSTTRDGNGELVTPDKQFKMYFPKDDDTKKLHIDKRLACEVIYDSRGEEIMNVYRITGYDSVSTSYGNGGHLLVLNARSEDYVPSRDSIEEMICDYIHPGGSPAPDPDEPEQTVYDITGPKRVYVGTSRAYSVPFDDPIWTVTCSASAITNSVAGGVLTLTVPNRDDMIGELVQLSAENDAGTSAAFMNVEVIG